MFAGILVAQGATVDNGIRVSRIALAAALLVLTGCTDDAPKPQAVETTTPSATPTETPTSSPTTAPTLPPEAQGTSKKAAEAFVRYAVDVLNYTAADAGCRSARRRSRARCAGVPVASSTARARSGGNGGSIEGGEWTFHRLARARTATCTMSSAESMRSRHRSCAKSASGEAKDISGWQDRLHCSGSNPRVRRTIGAIRRSRRAVMQCRSGSSWGCCCSAILPIPRQAPAAMLVERHTRWAVRILDPGQLPPRRCCLSRHARSG